MRNRGFTLVEQVVTVVALGVTLISFIPRIEYQQEQPTLAKAMAWGSQLRDQQDDYRRMNGQYAHDLLQLLDLPPLAGYRISSGLESVDWAHHWSLTVTREDYGSAFGDYTLVFGPDGLDSEASTVLPALLVDLPEAVTE